MRHYIGVHSIGPKGKDEYDLTVAVFDYTQIDNFVKDMNLTNAVSLWCRQAENRVLYHGHFPKTGWSVVHIGDVSPGEGSVWCWLMTEVFYTMRGPLTVAMSTVDIRGQTAQAVFSMLGQAQALIPEMKGGVR